MSDHAIKLNCEPKEINKRDTSPCQYGHNLDLNMVRQHPIFYFRFQSEITCNLLGNCANKTERKNCYVYIYK